MGKQEQDEIAIVDFGVFARDCISAFSANCTHHMPTRNCRTFNRFIIRDSRFKLAVSGRFHCVMKWSYRKWNESTAFSSLFLFNQTFISLYLYTHLSQHMNVLQSDTQRIQFDSIRFNAALSAKHTPNFDGLNSDSDFVRSSNAMRYNKSSSSTAVKIASLTVAQWCNTLLLSCIYRIQAISNTHTCLCNSVFRGAHHRASFYPHKMIMYTFQWSWQPA